MSEYKHMYELLEAVGKVKSAKAKVTFLKDNDCLAIRDFLKGSFDNSITFNWIPKGSVPYTPKDIKADDISSLIDKTGSVLYSEALDACVFLCQKHSGHGSHQSVRNYLASLTSIVGPFKEIRNEQNKRTIVKRKEEEKFKEKIESENE